MKDIIRNKDLSEKKKKALMEEAEKENHRHAEKTQQALRNFNKIAEKEVKN